LTSPFSPKFVEELIAKVDDDKKAVSVIDILDIAVKKKTWAGFLSTCQQLTEAQVQGLTWSAQQ
jgi:hypothetical protein